MVYTKGNLKQLMVHVAVSLSHDKKNEETPRPSPKILTYQNSVEKPTRPFEQGNWDTWMVLDPWNQVYLYYGCRTSILK